MFSCKLSKRNGFNKEEKRRLSLIVWLDVSADVKWHKFSKINEANLICILSVQ